ncbi:MAG: prolyl aminopeptidase [Methylococcales symbiont of Iophon sp. n. MRB-2018]|nr:MAG: prolyl aminopeptidase [Methylococcales symbiont of Iophon sp. n. MRB-2018]KAF3980014.1 MAG: prolyl aminopeptidase [Methylococcales symbiont of Iophon sp. n. MRB-2018]
MKIRYPDIEPFKHFFLKTESEHLVYVEQSGNIHGIPVIFLHGGPCSGTKPNHRCFFNPEKYHIILMDQRGCGQSQPFGELKNNTTQYLIEDMENIRIHLNIKKWLIFGGSWGSTLTLLYAQQHKEKVLGMVIRGIFLARQKDMDWFIKESGVGMIFPEKWQQLMNSVPQYPCLDIIKELYDATFSQDEVTRKQVTKAWMEWGGQVALMADFQEDEALLISEKMMKQVQMELHYAENQYFISENQVLKGCDVLQDIPVIIVHGRNDLACPMEAAVSLSKFLPHAQFKILQNSGHIASGEEMINALVGAADNMLELIQ